MRPPYDSSALTALAPDPAARRRVRSPELFADARAREVARILCEHAQVLPGRATDLLKAVEAYDLASARMQWVEDCRCQSGNGQRAAIGWHAAELHHAHVAMLTSLRDATAFVPKQAS